MRVHEMHNQIAPSGDVQTQPVARVKFATLGCRLNQYETQAIREQFLRAGFQETAETGRANVFVLNTCTVTRESDRECRYLIRRLNRENPNAKIIVTGCYVERNQKEVSAMPGVTFTALNREKSDIVRLLESCASGEHPPVDLPSKRRFTPLSISAFSGRTRAYVKVQDGCNHACSFCKVVLVRGPSRSRQAADALDEVKHLVDGGWAEVVLTGIQLGAYGIDLSGKRMLSELLNRLVSINGLKRIRLSSIEPIDVTDELIDTMASDEKICPHLHIPLQSASNKVLKRMNRRYNQNFYLKLVAKLKRRIRDFVLSTDVMVGFPGETDFQFRQTIDTLEETEPYKLHIFPYSRREGTKAAQYQGTVAVREVKQRKAALFALERKLRLKIQKRYLGARVEILTEKPTDEFGAAGYTRNYLRVEAVPQPGVPAAEVNELRMVRLERIEEDRFIGRFVEPFSEATHP